MTLATTISLLDEISEKAFIGLKSSKQTLDMSGFMRSRSDQAHDNKEITITFHEASDDDEAIGGYLKILVDIVHEQETIFSFECEYLVVLFKDGVEIYNTKKPKARGEDIIRHLIRREIWPLYIKLFKEFNIQCHTYMSELPKFPEDSIEYFKN